MERLKELIDKIIEIQLNRWASSFLAILIGAIVFCFSFDTHIINPSDISWILEGDRLQHYIGSYAFRLDEWHFPITKTNLIASPEGVSIVYTDSNPLLSIIFKILRPIFPPEYQFFGMWFFLCWMLQGLLGYLLMFKVTKNTVYSLLSAILFCLIPAMFHRIMHTNLIAFWVVLWAIYVFLSDDKKQKKKEILFFVIFVIGALIHGYLSIMAILIGGAWFLKMGIKELRVKNFKSFLFILLRACVLCFVFGMVLWACGFFYNAPVNKGDMGFGRHSMNILSPFDPTSSPFSTLSSSLGYNQTVEGFQYLGVGVMLLYSIVSLLIIKRLPFKVSGVFFILLILLFTALVLFFKEIPFYHKSIFLCSVLFSGLIVYSYWKERTKFFLWLFVPAFVGLVLALSQRVSLGDVRVLRYSIPESGFGQQIFQMIRASSRFFWITNIVLLMASLLWIYIYSSKKRSALVVLLVCILIQVVDLSGVSLYLNNKRPKDQQYIIPLHFQKMISKAKKVVFLRATEMNVSLFAIQKGIPINSFYMTHGNGKITKQKLEETIRGIEDGEILLNDTTVYFINKSNRTSFDKNKNLKFYNFNKKLFAITTSGFEYDNPNLLVMSLKGKTLMELVRVIPQERFLIIAVKDEASKRLPFFFSNTLDSTYGTTLFNLKFGESYIAVFQKGKLIYEAKEEGGPVSFKGNLEGVSVVCNSFGGKNVLASVLINGTEMALNRRGLNIVSLNVSGVYSSLNFDTYANEYNEDSYGDR